MDWEGGVDAEKFTISPSNVFSVSQVWLISLLGTDLTRAAEKALAGT
jgi:hypothetical protein